ncbi:zinc-dependent metalloprotease [Roseivirga sp. UBA1976]|uniref:zinc-dependent metalloprotease n=1 Tax=Roseivirga sp. UBA1976 TaxID=1947386 RepID=UPI002579E90C|nr:zinc-dependent metalloprotease [Roseivirga sp. UBA1976]MEC7755320.1 zinc-dependent metalloprotease [Bacteroidota bacterium]|tara:strand:+ start:8116 stop:10614 length:2499 start_codon:yes stop_codon:yes gene_type:complete
MRPLKTTTKSLFTLLLAAAMIFSLNDANAQRRNKKKQEEQKASTPPPEQKAPPKKGGIQPFEKVITKDAESDEGLFNVHKLDDKYYFEIPDALLGRDMLMVTRIAKTASGIGFGGGKTNTQMLRWEKVQDRIQVRIISTTITAADSLPIAEAVLNSNFAPILASFPIKAHAKDSAGSVIDVTSLLTGDNKTMGLPNFYRTQYRVTRLDNDRSYVTRVSSYPENIELRHVKTYLAGNSPSADDDGSITVEMSNSMILLPKEPMKRRLYDRRVGWFARGTTDYGLDVQQSKTIRYLDRWRLEVKEEDIEKFKRGELVEPKKQIVYYIDRATPKKWVKYIKQGVEDWQVAFEAAGFKNAIIAKEAPSPEEDPDWSPEDVRYSTVRYLASPIPNANGPHVSDPRSGEILESDINWYHNVMTLLRRWFFVQTAAINPMAQSPEFDDEVMGRLIRFVSSHEVGHTLGLPHNFASSYAYPVDSLRSASFTSKMGTAPSIMDYARFNYIAQPEDKGVALMPNIGIYDKYAIAWGYRPILDAKTPEDELPTLRRWIEEKNGDPLYRYGRQGNPNDYTAQSEDLGDDAMRASNYGIENLKRIMKNLRDWTYVEGSDYSELEEMYGEVRSQFNRYMGHVGRYVGGVKEDYKTADQDGMVYTHAPKAKQKEAVEFLNNQLFNTPKWMLDNEILGRLQDYGAVESMRSLQVNTLYSLLEWRKLGRVIENAALNGSDAYTITELFSDVRNGIWSELRRGSAIDTYRRNLQRAHIERLETLLTEEAQSSRFAPSIDASQSDIRAVARGELKALQSAIRAAIPRTSDSMSKLHLEDALVRVNNILDPK